MKDVRTAPFPKTVQTTSLGVPRTVDGMIRHLEEAKRYGVPANAYVRMDGDQSFTAVTVTLTWQDENLRESPRG